MRRSLCLAALSAILLGNAGCAAGKIHERSYLRAVSVSEKDGIGLTMRLFSAGEAVTASGSSIDEAKNRAELLTGEPMFTGYTELLVVDGRDCRDILGHMLNEWKVSPSCMVVCSSDGRALLEQNDAELLMGMTEQAVKQGIAPECDVITVLTELCSSGCAEVAELSADGSVSSAVIS